MTGFFRYPGGKSKIKNVICKHLSVYASDPTLEYREPFFGGGSIGLKHLLGGSQSSIWINDKDPGISCLWTAVILYPDELKDRVKRFAASVIAFDAYKMELLQKDSVPNNKHDLIRHAFMKLAIHQISYSGLGTKSGGPLGGRSQSSKYKIDCRWSPHYICKKIDHIHDRFSTFNIRENRCTNYDFADLIEADGNALLYLDPPYYVKGNDLYQQGMTFEDHERLASALHATSHQWILSYDDAPEIRALYAWAEIEVVHVNYSITAEKDKQSGNLKSRVKPELLIYPTRHKERIDDCGSLHAAIRK